MCFPPKKAPFPQALQGGRGGRSSHHRRRGKVRQRLFFKKKRFFCEIRSFRLEHIFRGLDIAGVKTVVNYQVCDGRKKLCFSLIFFFISSIFLQLPNTLEQYIHRVGRTARAGEFFFTFYLGQHLFNSHFYLSRPLRSVDFSGGRGQQEDGLGDRQERKVMIL